MQLTQHSIQIDYTGVVIAMTSENKDSFDLPSGIVLPEEGAIKSIYINDREHVLCMLKKGASAHVVANQLWQAIGLNQKALGEKVWVELSALTPDLQTAAIRGVAMNRYDIGFFKTQKKENNKSNKTFYFSGASDLVIKTAEKQANVICKVLELVDRPGGQKTPQYLANTILQTFHKHENVKVRIVESSDLFDNELFALFSVGRGSKNPPLMAIVEYKGAPQLNQWHAGLVGKGVTFDTGGVSMKPSSNMHYMKSDMAGGAAMLGSIELADSMNLPLNIVAIIPAAENVVDANSILPGDVISSYSGLSIEVLDTDAEGRLLLADGLAWVTKKYQPEYLLDMATLTGSSVRTFATETACLYTNNSDLQNKLMQSAEETGERLWPMPLWSEYEKYLESDVADIRNIASIPAADSIIAAKFLQKFIANHSNWAHIDMPGMAFQDSPLTKMKAATGYGVMLIWNFLHNLAKEKGTE